MELENTVSPDAETQNPAPELVQPEVTTPEPEVPETADEPQDEDKTVKRMERRIQRLTSEKYQTRAQAEAAVREAAELRQKLAQYETPEEKPQGPDPLALAKEIARIDKVTEKSNAVAKDGATRFKEEFRSALQTVAREAGPLFDQYSRPTALGEAILDADDPAAVIHALGTDPDLAAELADLSPIQQARRIAKLEVALSKPKEPPKSAAPKPIEAIKGKASGEKDPAQMSDREFAEWRKRQIAQRR